jgi:hypothetical protein
VGHRGEVTTWVAVRVAAAVACRRARGAGLGNVTTSSDALAKEYHVSGLPLAIGKGQAA